MGGRRWRADLKQGLGLLVAASGGAWMAQRVGIPAGVIVGALLASGLYRLAGRWESGTAQLSFDGVEVEVDVDALLA